MMPRMMRLVLAAAAAVACSTVACSTVPSLPDGAGIDAGTPSTDAGAASAGVTFRLGYVSDDLPASVLVQASGYGGHPEWVTVRDAAGQRVRMFRPCEVCDCAACGACGVCGAAMPRVEALASGAAVSLAWDGVTYPGGSCGAGDACFTRAPLAAGAYVATFCWGTAEQGGFVSSLECKDVPFVHPVAGGVVGHLVDRAG
jgi:hypothetical protein